MWASGDLGGFSSGGLAFRLSPGLGMIILQDGILINRGSVVLVLDLYEPYNSLTVCPVWVLMLSYIRNGWVQLFFSASKERFSLRL